MTHYACLSVENNVCTEWAQQVGMLPALTAEQGFQIGGGIVLAMVTAWGFRFLLRFILNR